MSLSEYSISYYENHIPDFVEYELDQLYGARYASLPFYRIYGNAEGASTYLARKDGKPEAIFLFKRKRGQVKVLNEGVRISQQEASRFADHLFEKDSRVNVICFNYIETEGKGFSYPSLRMCCDEDLVLRLPDTVEQYMSSLGKSTRANLKNRLNKLKRDFPSFAFNTYEKDAVNEDDVREIIRLSRLRMSYKDKISEIDSNEEKRIIACVRKCGFVCIATIDGQICAGSIAFRIGRNFTGRIIAHDHAYDIHRLGFTCAFLAISECIKQKGCEYFYFGWGSNDYKLRLGGTTRQLGRLVIFRSWTHVFLNARLYCHTVLSCTLFHVKRKILDYKNNGNAGVSYTANFLVQAKRWLKARKARLLGQAIAQ